MAKVAPLRPEWIGFGHEPGAKVYHSLHSARTTGNFSMDARKESVRAGTNPIDLVDGEKLVKMFERLELGLKPRTVYEVDPEFFKEYQ